MNEIPLPQLRALVAVAEARSFSRAARALGVSQSTVSTQILKLEQRVGATLIERTTRSVEPTAAAQRLLPIARDILRLQQIAASRLDARPLSGMVVFAADESAALGRLARGSGKECGPTDLRSKPRPRPCRAFRRGARGRGRRARLRRCTGARRTALGGPNSAAIAFAGTGARPPASDPRWPIAGLPRRRASSASSARSPTARRPIAPCSRPTAWRSASKPRAGFGLIALPGRPPVATCWKRRAPGLPALGSCPVRLLQRADRRTPRTALRNEIRSAWPLAARGRVAGRVASAPRVRRCPGSPGTLVVAAIVDDDAARADFSTRVHGVDELAVVRHDEQRPGELPTPL